MRKKNDYKRISVTIEVYERLIEDRNHFQKVIGGGKWGISDTIAEYWKIMKKIKKKLRGANKQKKTIKRN